MSIPLGTPGRDQFLDDESWQPDKEDGLLQTDTEDVLDDGLTAPVDDPLAGLDLSPRGQVEGEALRDRLAREEPDRWDEDGEEDPAVEEEDDPDLADDEADRPVGRLVALPDDDDDTDEPGEWQDVLAEDVGVGDLTAEEAAMHLLRDGDGGLTDAPDPWGPVWDERR